MCVGVCVCVCMLSHVQLCNSMYWWLQSMGILQARILEWVAMLSSRGFFQPRDQSCVSYVTCLGK